MNIMVSYDGSTAAKKAVQIAQKRAKTMRAVVFIVKSYSKAMYDSSGDKAAEKLWKDVERAEQELNDIRTNFDKDKIICNTHISVKSLDPGEDLVTYAEKNKIDEIIISI